MSTWRSGGRQGGAGPEHYQLVNTESKDDGRDPAYRFIAARYRYLWIMGTDG
jgi:hypothetical protein